MGYETASVVTEEVNTEVENSAELNENQIELNRWKNFLYIKFDRAVSEEAMLYEEALPWYVAVEDCNVVEHLAGLSEYFDDYYEAGARAREDYEDAVVRQMLLTAREKVEKMSEVRRARYHERLKMYADLRAELASLEKVQKQFEQSVKQLAGTVGQVLEKSFYEAGADEKPEIIKQAGLKIAEQAKTEAKASKRKEVSELGEEATREIEFGSLVIAKELVSKLGALAGYQDELYIQLEKEISKREAREALELAREVAPRAA
jgi:hypothetical protein